ncbi:uroporphyrinogen-III synthase [Caulobacter sp. DWR2-3-1b2]|uniref:uroporphyrinogen-III synthase n=1 Tax=unclassified Caulobacter TaxID=2648921 RepID=UPI003CFAA758
MTGESRRIWVTRASPGAEATAARLEAMGFTPLVDPLLTVRDLSPVIDLTGVAALAFTSVNGVSAFARASPDRSRRAFAVGDRTAAAAREAGFARVESAEGDVEALAWLIAGEAAELDGVVLHPGALEPAGDLVAPLAEAGVTAIRLALYETVARDPAPTTLAAIDTLAAALVYSPRAARTLAALLAHCPAPRLRILCLSPAVAAPLGALGLTGGLRSVTCAPRPTETALLSLLTL